MKSRSLILSGACVLVIIAGIIFTTKHLKSSKETEENEMSEKGEDFQGAAEYYNLLRADPRTGQINLDVVKALYRDLENMPHYRSGLFTGPDKWESKGPDNVGGRSRALVIDKDNPNILYTGGVSGGIFKSVNGGQYWVRKYYNTNLGGLTINCMVQTKNGDLYAGTGEMVFTNMSGPSGDLTSGLIGSGVFKSTDRGETWSKLASTSAAFWNNVQMLAADPNNGQKLYAATMAGLWVTDNGGTSFSKITPGSPDYNFTDVKVSPDGNTVFAASLSNNAVAGLYKYTVGGSFSMVTTSALDFSKSNRICIAISPSNPNYIYVSASSNGSTGNRGVWNALEGVIRSTDNGSTWEMIVSGGTEAEPFATKPSGSNFQGSYDQCIAVDPENPNRFYLGGVEFYIYKAPFFYKGASLSEFTDREKYYKDPRYIHADKHYITFDIVSNPHRMYVTTDGGISVSENYSLDYPTYKTLNINFNTTQFYALAANVLGDIVGGTQDNGSLRIETNGLTGRSGWQVLGGDGFYAEISKIEPSYFITETYNAEMSRSKDKGKNQISVNKNGLLDPNKTSNKEFFPFNSPFRLWDDTIHYTYTDPKHTPPTYDTLLHVSLFAVGGYDKVWVTPDILDFTIDTVHWYKAAIGLPFSNGHQATCMEMSKDGNTLFIGGARWTGMVENGVLYRISGLRHAVYKYDAGGNFNPTLNGIKTEKIKEWSGMIVTGIGISPGDENNMVVTLGNYVNGDHVYLTHNALDTISPVSFASIQGTGLSTNMPVYDAAIHSTGAGTKTIIIGTEMGIWSTTSGDLASPTWVEDNEGMDRVATYMIRQVRTGPWSDGFYYYIATHGLGIFKAKIGTNLGTQETPRLNKSELGIYPNPTSQRTNVKFILTQGTDVRLQIFDLGGKLVKYADYKALSVGETNCPLDVNGLKPGTYIIRATGNKLEAITKLTIIR
jgi:hypothetical protein